MSEYLIQDSTLTNIANSIRSKTGKADPILTENMANEIDSITGGGGDNLLEYMSSFSLSAQVPVDYALTVNMPNLSSLNASFRGIKLRSFKLISNSQVVNMVSAFYGCQIDSIDFSEFTGEILNGNQVFAYCSVKEILGELRFAKEKQSFYNCFVGCNRLIEVRLKPNSISEDISFQNSSQLSDASIQSIIDSLATVEVAKTLRLYPNVKAKLTTEQTQTITAKNWILA